MHNELVKNFFNSIAGTYEHTVPPFAFEFLRSLKLENYPKIIDLGCGKGVITSFLKETSGSDVIGLDISDEMISFARKNNPDIPFVCEDFHHYESSPVNAIICFDCYPHFLDVDEFIEKANELLTKDGLLVIFHDIGRPILNEHHKRSAGKVSRLLKEPKEEVKPFLKYFEPLLLEESSNFYKLVVKKR